MDFWEGANKEEQFNVLFNSLHETKSDVCSIFNIQLFIVSYLY